MVLSRGCCPGGAVLGWCGGLEVNEFEQVSSVGHQMSVVEGIPGLMSGERRPVQRGPMHNG